VGSSLGSGLLTAPVFTNPADRDKDYVLSPNHVTHDFRSYGTFELPLGPNKLLLRNSSGWVARVVEGFQTSFIINLSTGQPTSVVAGNTLYNNGVPDVVGPFLPKSFGNVRWNGQYGSYFGSGTGFTKITDPQCGQVAVELKPYCTLQAVSNASTGQ